MGGASGVDVAEVGNAVEGVAKGGAVVRPTEIWAANLIKLDFFGAQY